MKSTWLGTLPMPCRLMLVLAVAPTFSTVGCTHQQLRWNTVQQSRTLTDIYEQQVLDNLAMFVVKRDALPFLSYPNAGGSNITDGGSGASTTGWGSKGFVSQALNLTASRSMTESWTLTPVSDVRRLELMRCGYHTALCQAGVYAEFPSCPDSDKIQRRFYMGDENSKESLEKFQEQTGRTTPECLMNVKWFAFGPKKCIPKDYCCEKVGHYCGTYVWVCPGGQDELTKLTLIMLDYAFSPQATPVAGPPSRTMEVTTYLDKNHNEVPSSQATHVVKTTGTVPKATPSIDGVKSSHGLFEMQLNVPLSNSEGETKSYSVPPIVPPITNSFLQFDQNFRNLVPPSNP